MSSIKPIEEQKRRRLKASYAIAEAWLVVFTISIFFLMNGGMFSVSSAYLYIIPSALFCIINSVVLFYLFFHNKISPQLTYLDLFPTVLFVVLTLALYPLNIVDRTGIGFVAYLILIGSFQLAPNIVSLRYITRYGTELLTQQERRYGGQKLKQGLHGTLSALPTELSQSYPQSELIGEGGFSRVFAATRTNGTQVAVKVLKTPDETAGKLFVKEAANWSTLKHKNIVALTNYNVVPIPYIETELCDGNLKVGPSGIDWATDRIREVAEGLRYAHSRHIIHGDIKPQNILIKDGRAKLSDWGLSKVRWADSTSEASRITGFTLFYAAPEELAPSDFGAIDERTDIWQLGVVFYQLVTGKLPFDGTERQIMHAILNDDPRPPSAIRSDARKVEKIILKCLKRQKAERYQTVGEIIAELAVFAGEHKGGETTVSGDVTLPSAAAARHKEGILLDKTSVVKPPARAEPVNRRRVLTVGIIAFMIISTSVAYFGIKEVANSSSLSGSGAFSNASALADSTLPFSPGTTTVYRGDITYRNPSIGVTFIYPQNWTKFAPKMIGANVYQYYWIVRLGSQNLSTQMAFSIENKSQYVESTNNSNPAYNKAKMFLQRSLNDANLSDVTILKNPAPTTLGGLPAFNDTWSYNFTSTNVTPSSRIQTDIFAERGNYIYSISYAGIPADYNESLSIAKQIIDSFEFI